MSLRPRRRSVWMASVDAFMRLSRYRSATGVLEQHADTQRHQRQRPPRGEQLAQMQVETQVAQQEQEADDDQQDTGHARAHRILSQWTEAATVRTRPSAVNASRLRERKG